MSSRSCTISGFTVWLSIISSVDNIIIMAAIHTHLVECTATPTQRTYQLFSVDVSAHANCLTCRHINIDPILANHAAACCCSFKWLADSIHDARTDTSWRYLRHGPWSTVAGFEGDCMVGWGADETCPILFGTSYHLQYRPTVYSGSHARHMSLTNASTVHSRAMWSPLQLLVAMNSRRFHYNCWMLTANILENSTVK